MRRVVLIVLVVLGACSLSYGQLLLPLPSGPDGSQQGFSWQVGARKFFSSFITYQYPNAQVDPAFTHEWPIDQWFLGLRADYSASTWKAHAELWHNVTRDSNLKHQNSDWGPRPQYGPGTPFGKSIFILGKCVLDKGILGDIGVSYPVLRLGISIAPVFGLRMQRFTFTSYDGDMSSFYPFLNGRPLPQDMVYLQATIQHYYIGGSLSGIFNLGEGLPSIELRAQADYAAVNLSGYDDHQGLFPTASSWPIRTNGWGGHLAVAAALSMPPNFKISVDFDFNRVRTNGEIQNVLAVPPTNVYRPLTLWSDQASLGILGVWRF
jgi:hypothetical protein